MDCRGFPLNGCDTFMLAMDQAMARDGSSRNVCHLLLTLSSSADLASIVEKIASAPAFLAASRLRLVTRFARTPRWIPFSNDRTPEILTRHEVDTESTLHAFILSRSLDPRHAAPFGVIALPTFHTGPSLLFYWHHALCDAHGGEALIQQIVTNDAKPSGSLTPVAPQRVSRVESIRRAHRIKEVIFAKTAPSIARLPARASASPLHRYALITFNADQSKAVERTVTKIAGGIFPTAVYLAATARAVAQTTLSADTRAMPMFVPVPHDMRRVTKQPSCLSNQISMAFFRLTPSQFSTLAELTDEVIGQLHETIANRYHECMSEFLRLLRRVPSRLFWKIIEQPTAGHPASFYFSDVGASLSSIERVYEEPVTYASHYPPNLAPPGLTTVWSRYRGSLQVTICYDQSRVSEESLHSFIRHLHDDLIASAT
jgi:hypothetical protein